MTVFCLSLAQGRLGTHRTVCLPWAPWRYQLGLHHCAGSPANTQDLIGPLLGNIQLVNIVLQLGKNMPVQAVVEFDGTCLGFHRGKFSHAPCCLSWIFYINLRFICQSRGFWGESEFYKTSFLFPWGLTLGCFSLCCLQWNTWQRYLMAGSMLSLALSSRDTVHCGGEVMVARVWGIYLVTSLPKSGRKTDECRCSINTSRFLFSLGSQPRDWAVHT